mmetsp:Transcript_119110/g.234024  ORF Transcript_119110/g.234024 Transcript_119110/m.234024 type:complete len:235 (+) Transcript_119110:373-1077(+)
MRKSSCPWGSRRRKTPHIRRGHARTTCSRASAARTMPRSWTCTMRCSCPWGSRRRSAPTTWRSHSHMTCSAASAARSPAGLRRRFRPVAGKFLRCARAPCRWRHPSPSRRRTAMFLQRAYWKTSGLWGARRTSWPPPGPASRGEWTSSSRCSRGTARCSLPWIWLPPAVSLRPPRSPTTSARRMSSASRRSWRNCRTTSTQVWRTSCARSTIAWRTARRLWRATASYSHRCPLI